MPLAERFAATYFVRRNLSGKWLNSADVVYGSPAGEQVIRRVEVDPRTGEGAQHRALHAARVICRQLLAERRQRPPEGLPEGYGENAEGEEEIAP